MHNNDYTDQFQSTPSVWRETKTAGIHGHSAVISIHSLRVEGDACPPGVHQKAPISIHSLRVEGDKYGIEFRATRAISIHSLRVEGDCTISQHHVIKLAFQSTPSVWRETLQKTQINSLQTFQSTPSVWRETKPSIRV